MYSQGCSSAQFSLEGLTFRLYQSTQDQVSVLTGFVEGCTRVKKRGNVLYSEARHETYLHAWSVEDMASYETRQMNIYHAQEPTENNVSRAPRSLFWSKGARAQIGFDKAEIKNPCLIRG